MGWETPLQHPGRKLSFPSKRRFNPKLLVNGPDFEDLKSEPQIFPTSRSAGKSSSGFFPTWPLHGCVPFGFPPKPQAKKKKRKNKTAPRLEKPAEPPKNLSPDIRSPEAAGSCGQRLAVAQGGARLGLRGLQLAPPLPPPRRHRRRLRAAHGAVELLSGLPRVEPEN